MAQDKVVRFSKDRSKVKRTSRTFLVAPDSAVMGLSRLVSCSLGCGGFEPSLGIIFNNKSVLTQAPL